MSDDRPIGVFDSGVGGLTVAHAIWEQLPNESVIYVGDGAHFPYGPKPVDEIRRYAMGIARYLVDLGVKMLVVACNSIEVSAIGDIAASADVPVVGVIGPGVRAALRATRSGVIGVIGTEATIRTGGYQRAVGSAATLLTAACPAFVEFVERGDTTSRELQVVAAGYLAPLEQGGVDTVIMGCTHYPLLSGLLQIELGPEVVLVSSAEETARDVYAELVRSGGLRSAADPPHHAFLTTGDADAFRSLAELFLGREVTHVDAVHITAGVAS
jgi:glutamate racemase